MMKPSGREYFYVSEAGSHDGLRVALAWLMSWGDLNQDGIVLVPVKRQFERGYQLADVLGVDVAKALGKGRRVKTPSGRYLAGYTVRTFPRYARHGPVLAVWLREKSIEVVQDSGAEAVCLVPWAKEDGLVWARGVGASDLMGVEPTAPEPVVSDPVVAIALVSLTRRVNLSTGIVHPMDRSAAVWMFRILRKGGHTWTGDEVKASALRHGWEARHAGELGDMADGFLQGRRYRADKRSAWAADTLKQWRSAANG